MYNQCKHNVTFSVFKITPRCKHVFEKNRTIEKMYQKLRTFYLIITGNTGETFQSVDSVRAPLYLIRVVDVPDEFLSHENPDHSTTHRQTDVHTRTSAKYTHEDKIYFFSKACTRLATIRPAQRTNARTARDITRLRACRPVDPASRSGHFKRARRAHRREKRARGELSKKLTVR